MERNLEVARINTTKDNIRVSFIVEGTGQTFETNFPIKDGIGYYENIRKAYNQLCRILVEEARKVF